MTAVWDAWLGDVIAQRLRTSSPTADELAAWGDLALRLLPFLVKALELTNTKPGPLGDGTKLDDLTEEELRTYKDLIAQAVLARLAATHLKGEWHVGYQLGVTVPKLRSVGVETQTLRHIVDEAMRLGIHEAPSWIE